MKLNPFESTILEGWETVHKKAQMSLWILLAIRERKGFAEEILRFIKQHADLEPGEQSLYRSLRRLESATIVKSVKVDNSAGPDRKLFTLTNEGQRVLESFIERNIVRPILSPSHQSLFISNKEK